jgi:outer membrane murein-binding lipoprotein Lpp
MGRRMARKDRAPTPPKRPQAPQRRTTPKSAEDAARTRRLVLLAVAGALVVVAVVLGALFLTGGESGEEKLASTMEEAGCELQAVPAQVGDHSAELDATDDKKWNTDPPTSGPHNPVPAVYGEYDEPLKIAQVVHNLEHGAIFVFYGEDVPDETVAQLREFYADDRRGILFAPYPKLGDEIGLGAWTVPDDFEPGGSNGTAYLATCKTYDEDAFSTFRDELRFKGPERFPPDSLEPGVT